MSAGHVHICHVVEEAVKVYLFLCRNQWGPDMLLPSRKISCFCDAIGRAIATAAESEISRGQPTKNQDTIHSRELAYRAAIERQRQHFEKFSITNGHTVALMRDELIGRLIEKQKVAGIEGITWKRFSGSQLCNRAERQIQTHVEYQLVGEHPR